MKHAFCREVRLAGHRNAGFAAASRRLTVGWPFKAGTLRPRRQAAPRQRRLNPTHRRGLRSHPSLCDGVWGWVAETGLERPAYAQMPLRGNENVQTPEQRRLALPSCSSCVLLNSPAHKQTAGSEKSRLISTQPPWVRRAAFCESEGRPLWAPLMPTVQNRNFKATCPMRGERAPVTTPKVPLRKLPVGFTNWAWLKALKNSPRSWSVLDSVSRMFL